MNQISSLRLVNFKNFADETLRMGPFTVIAGANASGKSNIRDAFRFLHGIGRGYTLAEILGGKYGAGGQSEWTGIRGAPDEIIRFGESSFTIQVQILGIFDYTIEIRKDSAQAGTFRVAREELKVYRFTDYTSHPGENDPVHAQNDDIHLLIRMGKTGEQRRLGHRFAVRPNQPALTQLEEHKRVVGDFNSAAGIVRQAFADIRFLDLDPQKMRQPSFPGQTVLGDSGENLPTVLREICSDPKLENRLAEWIRELTPMDVQAFEFPTDSTTGWVQLVIRESNDRRVSAYGASDGTLRLLAMLAALLGNDTKNLFVLEEIDNGIHPSRIQLLIDLIEGQTGGQCQVVTTTHSPDLLTLVNDDTFESASVVYRDENSSDGVIRPIAGLPKARELRASQGLGRLHSSGWMEDTLAFTEYSPEYGGVGVGLSDSPGGGRKALGEAASQRIGAIRQKCSEDFDRLAGRLRDEL